MAERVVADRFRLIEPLGRGGMGTVWRAEDQVLGRRVALKEVSLPPSLAESERAAMRSRVLREARAAARLNHSSAVTVFDVLEEGDYTFIAMELVDSPTLAQIVEQDGPLAPRKAAFIALKLLDALEAAHGVGIVHRDVKPANVMVSDQSVKLADFGVASVKGDPQLTATGLLLGSPSYMSPEQVSGRPAGPASDLWALGATTYFAVEGRAPFDREGPLPTLMAIMHEELPEPSSAAALTPAIKSLLQKDPESRATAQQLRAMLEPLVQEAGPAEPIGVGSTNTDQGHATPEVSAVYLPPEAPPALAAFVARHEVDDQAAEEQHYPRLGSPAAGAGTTIQEEGETGTSVTLPVSTAVRQEGLDRPSSSPVAPVPDGSRSWAIAAGVLALLLLAFFLVPRLIGSTDVEPDPQSATDSTQADGNSTAGAPGDSAGPSPDSPVGGTTEDGDSSDDADSDDDEDNGSPAGVPAGWRTASIGQTGYRISHPASWSVRNNPLGDGSSLRFNGPDGRYLLVDWTNDPGDDALEAWEELSASFARRHQDYREIRLERTQFRDFPTAAIWEWTYTERGAELRAANLGFADEENGFALNFQTRAADWRSAQDEFEAFQASFREE